MSKFLAALKAIKEILFLVKGILDGFKRWRIKTAGETAKSKIEKAFKERDTKAIEEVLGHPNPGEPTKHDIPDLKIKPTVMKGSKEHEDENK